MNTNNKIEKLQNDHIESKKLLEEVKGIKYKRRQTLINNLSASEFQSYSLLEKPNPAEISAYNNDILAPDNDSKLLQYDPIMHAQERHRIYL